MPVVRISEEIFKEVQKYAEPLVDNFESALWKALKSNGKASVAMLRKPRLRATGTVTHLREFKKPILETLVVRGGRAFREDVHEAIEGKMKSQLKPGDYESNRDGMDKWRKAVDYARLELVHDGLLLNNSPRGTWEITDKGRQQLSSHQ